jgi:sialate O-acetylesterase
LLGVAALHPLQSASLLVREESALDKEEMADQSGQEGEASRSARLGQAVASKIFEGVPSKLFAVPLSREGAVFSGTFGNGMVLQRSPEKAAIYGKINCTHYDVGMVEPSVHVNMTSKTTGSSFSVQATLNADLSWKAFLTPTEAGGDYTISVNCEECCDTSASTISRVTFGDVFVCSGQSNQWLPMMHSFNKNSTFARIQAGELQNIRTLQIPQGKSVNRADGEEIYVLDPSTQGDGSWYVPGWQEASVDSVIQFSAACYYMAQELTDMAIERNETPVPFGLIGTYWGGTIIEMWMQNETVSNCKNASGDATVHQRDGCDGNTETPCNGALWNGMIAPLINMTIKAATWYQGENVSSTIGFVCIVCTWK